MEKLLVNISAAVNIWRGESGSDWCALYRLLYDLLELIVRGNQLLLSGAKVISKINALGAFVTPDCVYIWCGELTAGQFPWNWRSGLYTKRLKFLNST